MNERTTGSSDPTVAVRAVLDVLVFAPLGLGAKIVEDPPGAIASARQELDNARFIGRLTVTQGVRRLRERLDSTAAADSADSADSSTVSEPVETAIAPISDTPPDEEAPTVEHDVPAADSLALPDYDHLPAIDIVSKLAMLGEAERAAIGAYESTHRQRRTVLGKLTQLETPV